ncbi:fungal-specific transcription factor domain-containing protein [Mycena floridula]|nr:fungal-specific transcription factor domain-containing protein [Mycena floridula]
MPSGVCTSCIESGTDCTQDNAKKVALEFFQQHSAIRSTVSAILSPTTPYMVPTELSVLRLTLVELARYIEELEKALQAAFPLSSPSEPPSPVVSLRLGDNLTDHIREQSRSRFYGGSNDMILLKSVIDIRKEFLGGKQHICGYPRRPQYWSVYPWQSTPETPKVALIFPEPDLLRDLIELYFVQVNQYLPLFHKPTSDRQIANNLHMSNRLFGMLVLAICAVTARNSYDPRVLEDEVDSGRTELGVGWKYYRQISFYIQGTSALDTCWTYVGIAVRLFEDVGLHQKVPNESRTVEGELWKRAFCVIVYMDISLSTFLGRPRAMNPDDYDQDLPAECDDEYWDHPDAEQAFKQPAGKVPKSGFIFCNIPETLEYYRICAEKHGIILPKSPSSPQWDINLVAKNDSALNAWVDSLPLESRRGFLPIMNVTVTVYTSALILLLNQWRGRRLELSGNPGQEYAGVYKCLIYLRLYKSSDLIEELLNFEAQESPVRWSRDPGPYEAQMQALSDPAAHFFHNPPLFTDELDPGLAVQSMFSTILSYFKLSNLCSHPVRPTEVYRCFFKDMIFDDYSWGQ